MLSGVLSPGEWLRTMRNASAAQPGVPDCRRLDGRPSPAE